MSGGVPVSVSVSPDGVTPGGSVSGKVTLDGTAMGDAGQNVDLNFVEFPNQVGQSLLVHPPSVMNVPSGCRSDAFPLVTSAGSAGGTVVIIASRGPAAVATTLTIKGELPTTARR